MIDLAVRSTFRLVAGSALLGGMLLLPASGLDAQSLLSAGGLGIPNDAPDARSRMLGGVGIGLSGSHLLPHDPAAAGRVLVPGITASMETGWDSPDAGGEASRTRFPSFGLIYPHGGMAYSATFSGVLSQEWEARAQPTINFGDQEVQALDVFRGSGGISAARIGLARAFGDRLSVGVSAGSHIGTMERSFRRDLNPSDVGEGVEPFRLDGVWRATGATAIAGVNYDVSSSVRVAGSLTWSADLNLEPTGATAGEAIEVPMPREVRAGTFARLGPDLGLAASIYTADWSDAAEALGDESAPGRVWQWGGGLEWSGMSLLGREFPIGIGFRQRDLPFSFLGHQASERAVTGGIGLFLADLEDTPMARVHVSTEFGSRNTVDWEESFVRATVSLRVSGF